ICSIASAVTVNVTVGGGALTFNPQNISVNKNDVIQFNWASGNHSIIRSDALAMCTPSTKGGNAIISEAKTSGMTTFIVDGSDSNIWYYCGVNSHCRMGMWGMIILKGTGTNNNPANPSSNDSSSSSQGISGVIIGIIVGAGLIFIAIVTGSFYFIKLKNRRDKPVLTSYNYDDDVPTVNANTDS
ncbi:4211_t:CDS:2, partial [Cetraspora pellucida]